MSTPDLTGVQITRTISVPSSVSPEAQQFLAGTGLGGDASGYPPVDDIDAWRTFVDASNEMVLAMFAAQNADLGSTVDERVVGDVDVYVITPKGLPDHDDQPICLDIHGGGLVMGAGECCQAMGTNWASRIGMRTWSVDYRMPPDHPYPIGLDDCVAAYRELLNVQAPERIVVSGQSAGGNLAAALILRLRAEGLPLPGALVLLTPEVDLTESGDSFQTNLGIDVVLAGSLAAPNELYAGGADLADPFVSPLFGDFTPPWPPTLLQAGTRDLFLSNAVRMHRKLREAGVDAELHVFEAMPHGGFFGAPEDQEIDAEVQRFVAAHIS